MSPKVSICIPVYNGLKFIDETVRSVQAQTETDFELLIQDNCSTDGTWEYLQELRTREPRLRPERNSSNIGMSGNWNAVIDRAQGEYVLLLSADDLLDLSFLTDCLEAFRAHDAKVVSTDLRLLFDDHSRPRRIHLREGLYRHHASTVLLKNPFSINFTLFERELLDSMRRFGKVFGPYLTCDYGLHLRVALSGQGVYYIDRMLGTYRFHGGNLSLQTRRMNRQAALTVLTYREQLLQRCRATFDFTLLRFMLRAIVKALRGQPLDRRLIGLLARRLG
jgi:glycosyltransferase involved in cell wall biosynthesis